MIKNDILSYGAFKDLKKSDAMIKFDYVILISLAFL